MLRGSLLGGEWSCVAGLIRWCWVSKMCAMHAPDSQVMANSAGLLRAKSATHKIGWLERTMEGADAAPCFLERLSEAMLQWGWGLAAEIENGHLMYIYIYMYNITSNLQPD